jgi:glycine/D-amino acid oxidase-like deaminating enzyme
VIVGGARNTDREAETTASAELNPRIHAILDRVLADIVLPGRKTVVESRWAGIMGFAEPRCPIVRLRSDRIAVGFGCNSMGLAMGSAIGDELAALF